MSNLADDDPPEWYETIVAARYLGVPPWELAKQSIYWTRIAVIARNAEMEAGIRPTQEDDGLTGMGARI